MGPSRFGILLTTRKRLQLTLLLMDSMFLHFHLIMKETALFPIRLLVFLPFAMLGVVKQSQRYPIQNPFLKLKNENSSIIPTKQSFVSWLTHSNYFIQTGLNKDGFKELLLWDTRALNDPISVINSTERSPTTHNPYYDPCLPILYLSAKGEPLNIYEFENGGLTLIEKLKFEKPEVIIIIMKALIL